MKNLSSWRSVRIWQSKLERQLRQRHKLWLHGWCIGLLVMGLMWATAHLQMVAGSESLALRYFVTLGVGYLGYLLVLRLWAGYLVGRPPDVADAGADLVEPAIDVASHIPLPKPGLPSIPVSGGGGDFAGAGASADFSVASDAAPVLGEVASGAIDAVAGSDEGAVVVVPVVVVFLIGCLVVMGAGSLVLLYFGWEVLMTAAVEVAFSYVAARTAVRVAREGWLSAVLRLTWKPLLGALFCAVALGALLDHFVPTARSLPHALQLITIK